MNIILNELKILLVVFVPFVLVGIGAIFAAKTGFFQTEEIKNLKRTEQFYFDKLFRGKTNLVLGLLFFLAILYSTFLSIPDIFIIMTIWLSVICLRWTHNKIMKLQAFVWEEYANHSSKYNSKTKNYDLYPSKFRISYPTPNFDEKEMLETPPTVHHSEMMFIYKLFHGEEYRDKYTNWNEIREGVVRDFKKQKGKRALFLRTSSKLADKKVMDYWETEWGVKHLNPNKIWDDLKESRGFNDFAQKWHFYAILISRKTISDMNKWLFHPLVHLLTLLVFSVGYFSFINSTGLQITMEADIFLSSILFGVSVLCSIIYSILALMLFIYGKVITLDDFDLPLARLGEPFFQETSHVAITLSVSTAITVGLGIPLTLTLNLQSDVSIIGALLAGIITAFIFFLSVWGTHFSMGNTKNRVMENLFNQISQEKDSISMQILEMRYREVSSVPVWPINFLLYINIFAALIFPIILEMVFKRI